MMEIKQSSGIKNDRGILAQVIREGLYNEETLLFMMRRGNDGKMLEENSRHREQKIKMP